MDISKGDAVEVTTASGESVRMTALTGPVMGRDFTVIWVCLPAQYDAAAAQEEKVTGIPWPVSSVRALESA